jgi:hypothetical protein
LWSSVHTSRIGLFPTPVAASTAASRSELPTPWWRSAGATKQASNDGKIAAVYVEHARGEFHDAYCGALLEGDVTDQSALVLSDQGHLRNGSGDEVHRRANTVRWPSVDRSHDITEFHQRRDVFFAAGANAHVVTLARQPTGNEGQGAGRYRLPPHGPDVHEKGLYAN